MMYCRTCDSSAVRSVWHVGHLEWKCLACGHYGARSGEDIKADYDTDEALESANEREI